MQDVYKNIEECNLGKKRKVLIVSDDMVAYMISNKILTQQQLNYLLEADKCTAEKYSSLVNDTTLPSHNPLRFRKNLLEINFQKKVLE